MTFEVIVLIVAGTVTALLAGIFVAFSVAINSGLGKLQDVEYVRAMQSINRDILNPVFYMIFMGPVFLLPLATFLYLAHPLQFGLLAVASGAYIVGTFFITVAANVPLNEKLVAFRTEGASDQAITAARTQFEKPWNRLHTLRTVMAIVATVLIFIVCTL